MTEGGEMPLSSLANQRAQLRTSRIVLLLLSAAVVGFSFLERPHPTVFDPIGGRIVLALLGGLAFAGTFTELGKRSSPHLVQAVAVAHWGWLVYAFSRNGLYNDNALGLVLTSLVLSFACRGIVDLIATTGLVAAGLLYLYTMTLDPQYAPTHLAFIVLPLTMGLGWNAVQRTQLELKLDESNRNLDGTVQERTAELTHSLGALELEISERRRAEVEAIRANQAKSSFLANMSHELRTPLNAALGYTEMVVEELDERGDEDLVGDLHQAHLAQRRLLALIDDILDLSRIEADAIELRVASVPVHEVCKEALELARGAVNDQTEVVLSEQRAWAYADHTRLRQVLVNLIRNAGQFTESGRIQVSLRPEGERVRIDVQDTGIGISKTDLPRLFEEFTQGDESSTRKQGGAGLGLAISHKLVGAMDGRLVAESMLGKGSTFTVFLARSVA